MSQPTWRLPHHSTTSHKGNRKYCDHAPDPESLSTDPVQTAKQLTLEVSAEISENNGHCCSWLQVLQPTLQADS